MKRIGIWGVAEADIEDFKVIFLDVALAQSLLDLDLRVWFLNPEQEFINKGSLIEAVVGQEFLAYAHPSYKSQLFYWRRNVPGSEAEIDYLITSQGSVVPTEVKPTKRWQSYHATRNYSFDGAPIRNSDKNGVKKSMHMFLESHKNSPYGLRFSTQNYSLHEKIHSYPLYAVASIAKDHGQDVKAYEYVVN